MSDIRAKQFVIEVMGDDGWEHVSELGYFSKAKLAYSHARHYWVSKKSLSHETGFSRQYFRPAVRVRKVSGTRAVRRFPKLYTEYVR